MADAALVEAIRELLAASLFHGEGYRKIWARLRLAGIRTSKRRRARGVAQDVSVIVSDDDRAQLDAIVGNRNQKHKHVQRAQIVLLSAKRLPVAQVAGEAGVSRPAVWRWQRRFAEQGVAGLLRDKTGHPERRRSRPTRSHAWWR